MLRETCADARTPRLAGGSECLPVAEIKQSAGSHFQTKASGVQDPLTARSISFRDSINGAEIPQIRHSTSRRVACGRCTFHEHGSAIILLRPVHTSTLASTAGTSERPDSAATNTSSNRSLAPADAFRGAGIRRLSGRCLGTCLRLVGENPRDRRGGRGTCRHLRPSAAPGARRRSISSSGDGGGSSYEGACQQAVRVDWHEPPVANADSAAARAQRTAERRTACAGRRHGRADRPAPATSQRVAQQPVDASESAARPPR